MKSVQQKTLNEVFDILVDSFTGVAKIYQDRNIANDPDLAQHLLFIEKSLLQLQNCVLKKSKSL